MFKGKNKQNKYNKKIDIFRNKINIIKSILEKYFFKKLKYSYSVNFFDTKYIPLKKKNRKYC